MTAARVFKIVIRLCAGGTLLLGLGFWAGLRGPLLPLHLLFGITLVLSLCAVAGMSWAAAVRSRLGVGVFLSAPVVLLLGFGQVGILGGRLHWIIQVVHVAVGVLAATLGVVLASAVQQHRSTRA
jgi:hypothetical protein